MNRLRLGRFRLAWLRRRFRRCRKPYVRLGGPAAHTSSLPRVARRLLEWGRRRICPGKASEVGRPPKGHLVVYVGGEGEVARFVVPVVHFNHPLFGELLREAEKVFGFHHPGGITLPCKVADFQSVSMRVAAATGAAAVGRGCDT